MRRSAGAVLAGASVLSTSSATASVIPPDTRFEINASSVPAYNQNPMTWTAAVYLWDGTHDTQFCSAFFYDDNTVATAGHCLLGDFDHDGDREYVWTIGLGDIRVARSAHWNGSASVKPYGSCSSTGVGLTSGWVTSGTDLTQDYGAIRLGGQQACSLPSSWFPMSSLAPSQAADATMVAGYPGDRGPQAGRPYNLLKGYGLTATYDAKAICHTVDTSFGNSGGPLYQAPGGVYRAHGVHVGGFHPGTGQGYLIGCDLFNSAVRLNSTVQANLNSWRA